MVLGNYEEIGWTLEPNIISGRGSKHYLHEDICRNITPDLPIDALTISAECVLHSMSLGKEFWFPAGRESQPLYGPQRSLTFYFSLQLHFAHLSSLTESSLRDETISISHLPSAQWIAECFVFLRSSINICRVNERINNIKYKNYSSSLSLRAIIPL